MTIKNYEPCEELQQAIEHVEYLKEVLTCYDRSQYSKLLSRYLRYSCKGMKNVYKGHIVTMLRKSLEVAI